MGAYLELHEQKKEMGLISFTYFNQQTARYNHKDLKQGVKDNLDRKAEKKLALLKQDKSTYLTLELISILNDTKKSTNQIKESTNQIKGWVTFFGVLYIIGIVVYVISIIADA